jgi:hypothetical protein
MEPNKYSSSDITDLFNEIWTIIDATFESGDLNQDFTEEFLNFKKLLDAYEIKFRYKLETLLSIVNEERMFEAMDRAVQWDYFRLTKFLFKRFSIDDDELKMPFLIPFYRNMLVDLFIRLERSIKVCRKAEVNRLELDDFEENERDGIVRPGIHLYKTSAQIERELLLCEKAENDLDDYYENPLKDVDIKDFKGMPTFVRPKVRRKNRNLPIQPDPPGGKVEFLKISADYPVTINDYKNMIEVLLLYFKLEEKWKTSIRNIYQGFKLLPESGYEENFVDQLNELCDGIDTSNHRERKGRKRFKDLISTTEAAINEELLEVEVKPDSILLNQKKLKNEDRPENLEKIFRYPELLQPCIDILKEVEPPILTTNELFIGKQKGVFYVWIDELINQEVVKKYTDRNIYAEVISKRFDSFSITGSMFSGRHHQYSEDQYRKQFEVNINKVVSTLPKNKVDKVE